MKVIVVKQDEHRDYLLKYKCVLKELKTGIDYQSSLEPDTAIRYHSLSNCVGTDTREIGVYYE